MCGFVVLIVRQIACQFGSGRGPRLWLEFVSGNTENIMLKVACVFGTVAVTNDRVVIYSAGSVGNNRFPACRSVLFLLIVHYNNC